jgi:hypothetical protein
MSAFPRTREKESHPRSFLGVSVRAGGSRARRPHPNLAKRKRPGWHLVHPSRRTGPNPVNEAPFLFQERGAPWGAEHRFRDRVSGRGAPAQSCRAGANGYDCTRATRPGLRGRPFRIRAIGTLHDSDLLRPCRHSGARSRDDRAASPGRVFPKCPPTEAHASEHEACKAVARGYSPAGPIRDSHIAPPNTVTFHSNTSHGIYLPHRCHPRFLGLHPRLPPRRRSVRGGLHIPRIPPMAPPTASPTASPTAPSTSLVMSSRVGTSARRAGRRGLRRSRCSWRGS